ncbi:MAG TPA: hypothetical protein VG347_01930 [Verrucomicrobiae bacterium]|nr:hypothetical protein [Verrucomicrobiae bacterium]
MFNLEQSITAWRNQMLAAGIQSPIPLIELENHLREEVEHQLRSGLAADAAFTMAVQKIGAASSLQTEFSKTRRFNPPGKWERILAIVISLGVVIPFGAYGLLKNELSPGWRILGLANLAVIVITIFGCRYINRLFPVVSDRRIRTLIGLTFGAISLIGIIVFMNFLLPKFELTQGQLTVIVLWSMTLMAALGAVWAGLEEAARRQTALPTA